MNTTKKYLPFSQFPTNDDNYWKFALLCLIMKHYRKQNMEIIYENGAPTIRLVKHVEGCNFPMILYRIPKNL